MTSEERLHRILSLYIHPSLPAFRQRATDSSLESWLENERLQQLLALLLYSMSLEGDTIECGVYRGGTSAIIAQTIVGFGKMHYLCDSFIGLPHHREEDNYHRQGDFSDTSLESVRVGLALLGLQDVTSVLPGWFSDSLPTLSDRKFCFAHIDADYYESTWQSLEFLYSRLSLGGWIVIDDYNWERCEGVRKAVDTFFTDKPELVIPVYGHAAVIQKQ